MCGLGVGVLTGMGVSSRHLVIGFAEIEGAANRRFQGLEGGTKVGRDLLAEAGPRLGKLLERGQRVVEHCRAVEPMSRLIQSPERLGAVGIEFEELVQQSLRELEGGQDHLIQGPEQSEGVESSRLKTRPQVRRENGGEGARH